MKTLKTTILILTLITLTFACSKKDDEVTPAPKVYPEENFWQGFIINAGFTSPTSITSTLKEFGYKFIPRVKGKINSVVVKLPVSGSVGVRIWDLTTGARIGQETFTVPTANVDFTKTITPLSINKDKEYAISVYSENYYKYQRTSTVYPINSGNITISNFDFANGTATSLSNFVTSFGSVFIGNEINGNISFNFQQTE